MLDTKSLKLEKDIDGKVALSEVIDLLKELQQEVLNSVQEIKSQKARINRQKLFGTPKTAQRNRGSHLRLISGSDWSREPDEQKPHEISAMGIQHDVSGKTPASGETPQQVRNNAEMNLNHAVPEMEELQEIIGLLDKLEE